MQYEEAPSSVLRALQLLFFSRCLQEEVGRGEIFLSHLGSSTWFHKRSLAFFVLGDESLELRGALAVGDSAEH